MSVSHAAGPSLPLPAPHWVYRKCASWGEGLYSLFCCKGTSKEKRRNVEVVCALWLVPVTTDWTGECQSITCVVLDARACQMALPSDALCDVHNDSLCRALRALPNDVCMCMHNIVGAWVITGR